jgi:DNA-directed RNA polymerase subunit RPC12/RpoP
MYCMKCGAQLPDDASFCMRCGAPIDASKSTGMNVQASQASRRVLAPSGITELKCPSCGAPIKPQFGEMVITCEYCGSSITLGEDGWRSIEKHTMLSLRVTSKDEVLSKVHDLMDKGFLRRHLQESSTLEEATLSYVPYWIIPASARTSIVAADAAMQVGTIATTAALFGLMGGMGGGRRSGAFGGGLLEGAMLGTMMGGGFGGGSPRKAFQLDENYNYPVVALKALTQYQPANYSFSLQDRALFDSSKVPTGVKVLNGDVSEEVAASQAKTLVDQLQSQKAHSKYHMIQQIRTEVETGEGELLHAPVWFVRYDHKGTKIVLVVDANSGGVIDSVGF